jgi:hypothetical protein
MSETGQSQYLCMAVPGPPQTLRSLDVVSPYSNNMRWVGIPLATASVSASASLL